VRGFFNETIFKLFKPLGFIMIKIILGFVVIAGLSFYLLTKAGGDIDMGGEKHGIEVHETAPKAAASAPVTPASAAK
jgi:hypothetical protein